MYCNVQFVMCNFTLTFSSAFENSVAPTLFNAMMTPNRSFPLTIGAASMFLVVYPVWLSTKSLNLGFLLKKKEKNSEKTFTELN